MYHLGTMSLCYAVLCLHSLHQKEKCNGVARKETNLYNVLYQNDAIGLTERGFVLRELSASHLP